MMGTNEMDNKENKTIRKKKTIKFIILSVLIIAVISLTGFAFARYITSLNGQTQVQIAQWNFKVTAGGSQNLSINLADTRLANDTTEVDRTTVAPGTKGALVLNIDATENQVSLEYDIDLSLTQVPENLIFYSDADMTNAFLKENGVIHLDGYFLANAENKTASKTIYWQWPIETGSTQTEIDDNDELDSNWIGSDVILGIAATGKQIMGNPDEEYTVTFDLNGGTLANHGDSTQVTKQVAYGEVYGDLPVPTRTGYRFVGWNGKNLLNTPNSNEINKNGLSVRTNNNTWHVTGTNTEDTQTYGIKSFYQNDLPQFEKGKRYTLSLSKKLSGLYVQINYINTSGTAVALVGIYRGENIQKTFKIPNDYEYTNQYFVGAYNYATEINEEFTVQIEEGNITTAYEPYYVTDTTPVTQNKNHTLTAIWEPISN